MHHRFERIHSYQRNSHPRFTRADVVGLLVGAIWALWPSFAIAAEGGSSLYLPGGAGDILLALSPEPGLQVANTVFLQSGSVNTAVLQGKVDVGLDVDIALDIVAAAYTFDKPVLGARYTIAAAIPFGYASLDAKATGPFGRSAGVSDDTVSLADVALVPLQLNWTVGKFSFKLAESVIVPIGAYDLSDAINIGRNYWAFNTIAAVTWLNPGTGTELSVAPGLMLNTRNDDTDYKTGTEFHMDFTANQFLSKSFAVGLRGYYYRQITGDSGSGAALGDFKGKALGIGPGVFWQPEFAKGKLVLQAKWMHDLSVSKRLKSDYVTAGLAWKF